MTMQLTQPEKDETAALLAQLVKIPSVNADLADEPEAHRGEGRVYDYLRPILAGLGLKVSVQGEKEGFRNLVAVHATGREGPTLMLEAHADTVGSAGMSVDAFEPAVRQNRLYGRGACDTKGGMAAYLMALKMILTRRIPLRGTLVFVAAASEENGCKGAKALMAAGFKAAAAIVAEPTACRVVTAHKGAFWVTLTTRGRSAHGSCPEQGINAILLMTRVLDRINREMVPELQQVQDPLLGSPTVNIGCIRGGQQANIVPDLCAVELDRRVVPGEREQDIVERLRDLARAAGLKPDQLEIAVFRALKPLSCPTDHPLVRSLRRVLADLGMSLDPAGVPYCTDAGEFMAGGIASVVLGPGSIVQAHAPDEYVDLDQLHACTAIMAGAVADFLKPA